MSSAAASRPPATEPPWRVLFPGLFLLAFGSLLFEIALIRVLSYTIWHHFGYVVISTALLGVGAAGSFLAVRPGFGSGDLRSTLAYGALLAGVSMVAVLGFVSSVPLHPMSILREPGQAVLLLLYQVAAALPFFLSGLSVSLALREGARRVDRLYAFDLLGAGLGCVAAVALMNWLAPPGAVVVAGAALAGAAAVFTDRSRERALALGLALLFLLGAPLARRLPFTPDHSKEYSLLVALGNAAPIGHEWTALFRTDLLRNGPRPLGRTWGLSRAAPEPIEQPGWYLTHDATAGAGIYDLRADDEIGYVPYHIFQLPYLVANPRPKVLVIGVGGGATWSWLASSAPGR